MDSALVLTRSYRALRPQNGDVDRDRALADRPDLNYSMAAEILFLLETLEKPQPGSPGSLGPLRRCAAEVRLAELGAVYYEKGRWVEAEQAHQQSLAIRRECDDRQGEGVTPNSLGLVYRAQRRWTEAQQAHQKSLAIFRDLEDRRNEGITLMNLGNAYHAQGQWAEAEQASREANTILRSTARTLLAGFRTGT